MHEEMQPPKLNIWEAFCEFMLRFFWLFRKPSFVVMMGGPGAGKGTASKAAAPILKLAHISIGDLLRSEQEKGTTIGLHAAELMKKSEFVSDEIVLYLLRRELIKLKNWRGAIIDGFPRTEVQAQLLEQLLDSWGLPIPLVILIEVSEDDLIERLGGRLTCSNKSCGASFHVKFSPPAQEGVCDECGSDLYRREDDDPEVIPLRLEKFNTTTAPLLRFYEDNDRLIVVTSTNGGGADQVLKAILDALKSAG